MQRYIRLPTPCPPAPGRRILIYAGRKVIFLKRTYNKIIDEINVDRNLNCLKKRIRELRQQSHLSQQQLADDLNVKRSNIAAWETGTRLPRADHLKAMSDYFNVTADYLLGFVNEKYEKKKSNRLEEYRINKQWIKK